MTHAQKILRGTAAFVVIAGTVLSPVSAGASATPAGSFGDLSRLSGLDKGFHGDAFKYINLNQLESDVAVTSVVDNKLKTSIDSGATWKEHPLNDFQYLYNSSYSRDGQKQFIQGEAASWHDLNFTTSLDGGDSWDYSTTAGVTDVSQPVTSRDLTHVATLSDDGGFNLTTNSGASWSKVYPGVPPSSNLSNIFMSASGTTMIGVGTEYSSEFPFSTSYPFISHDSGATWAPLAIDGVGTLRGISIKSLSPDGMKIMAQGFNSSNARISVVSTDGGATWNQIAGFYSGINEAVVLDDSNKVLLVSSISTTEVYVYDYEQASLAHLLSHSASLQALSSSYDGNVMAILAAGPSNTYSLKVTADGGTNWSDVTVPGIKTWTKTAVSSDGSTIVASGTDTQNKVRAARSTNGGQTWTPLSIHGYQTWSELSSSDNGQTVIGTTYASEGIYISKNGGQTWRLQPVSGALSITKPAVSADGSLLVVRAGSNESTSLPYVSSDGGTSWHSVTNTGLSGGVGPVKIVDSSTVATASYSGLAISTDKGVTWTNRTPAGVQSIEIVSPTNGKVIAIKGYDASYNAVNYISSDKGVTWTLVGGSLSLYDASIKAVSQNGKVLFISGTDQSWMTKTYLSTDSGATWNDITINDNSSFATFEMSTSGNTIALITGSSGGGISLFSAAETSEDWQSQSNHLYVSHDKGATWAERSTDGVTSWDSLQLSANGKVIAASANYGAVHYVSTDQGATFVNKTAPQATPSELGYTKPYLLSRDGSHFYTVPTGDYGYLYGATYTAPTIPPSLGFTPEQSNGSSAPVSTNPNAPQPVTNDRPTFSGATLPNATVTVTVRSDPIVCTTVADENGNWSCTLPSTIPPGVHSITVELIDPDTEAVQVVGPYYIQIGDSATGPITVDPTTPLAPNTGINALLSVGNTSVAATKTAAASNAVSSLNPLAALLSALVLFGAIGATRLALNRFNR